MDRINFKYFYKRYKDADDYISKFTELYNFIDYYDNKAHEVFSEIDMETVAYYTDFEIEDYMEENIGWINERIEDLYSSISRDIE